jgi:hypothetical protein
MRTTIDLPDELYRTLKARAAISGVTLRDLVQGLIEQGLTTAAPQTAPQQREDPPVIIPPTGRPLPDLSPEALHRLEEEDDLERYARSPGR